MKLNILKRAGMLAASAAVCYGGVFGALTLNGLRYVRPTAENWSLLAYIEPASRIEQQVKYSSDLDGSNPEKSSAIITGYDERDRPIWSFGAGWPFHIRYSEHKVYNGDTVTWYNTSCGVKTTTYLQYDALGRLLRMEYPDRTIIRSYHGNEKEPYLVEDYNAQGVLQLRTEWKYNAETGESTRSITYSGNEQLLGVGDMTVNKLGYVVSESEQWTYDDASHTAVCIDKNGTVNMFWYDAQNRVLRMEMKMSSSNGPFGMVQVTDYTDITR